MSMLFRLQAEGVTMATAKELLAASELTAAIDDVTRSVKSNPSSISQRISLFELLLFTGDWNRAEQQLDVIGHQSMENGLGVQVYRSNLNAERDRSRVFADGFRPHFIIDPPSYVLLHLDAIDRLRQGKVNEAREILDRAEEERPAFGNAVNGEDFSDFRDYNDIVGPVLEAIVQDQYTWIPFEHISQLEIDAPKHLRDLVWTPARIEAKDGTNGEIYIHTLYEGSCNHINDQVKLGRMTDWKDLGADLYLGSGLRLFLVDGEDKALLDVRKIEFNKAI
jgi:type VI secretion system protein ImpE